MKESFKNYASKANGLSNFIDKQNSLWDLPKNNFDALKRIKEKSFHFEGFDLRLQFNVERAVSSTAKVDAKSIRERKCFLCSENLPQEQIQLEYSPEFSVLINPFPILPRIV